MKSLFLSLANNFFRDLFVSSGVFWQQHLVWEWGSEFNVFKWIISNYFFLCFGLFVGEGLFSNFFNIFFKFYLFFVLFAIC